MTVVVMGVTGCGKTEVGRHLAAALNRPFFDGDDFHPEANIRKMRAGTPLTDTDRSVWLTHLHDLIHLQIAAEEPIVLACSALKSAYRRQLDRNRGVVFVYLRITPETASARLNTRTGHYMPASLVGSQFEILEEPEAAVTINGELPLSEVCASALAAVRSALRQGQSAS